MTVLKIQPQSAFLSEMDARGHIYQVTDEKGLDAYAAAGVPCGYIGFDATAKSLHVGSLVQIMNLRRLQQAGGKPVVLMGGGTTKIGDPTDKEKSRPILTTEEIASNMDGIKKNFEPFLTFGDGPTDAIMVDNAEWLDQIKWIEFLRDFGKHFTINKMIAQETVRRRLDSEEPYTFLEFNYMLLQSYDFLELARRFDCRIQMGGSDQWGNIVNGIDLTRRIIDKQVFGVTTPLITTASGGKMGKTAEGAVWLNPEMRSPYDYWQFWRNTEDADVARFMRLFTDVAEEEIAELEKGPIDAAKRRLALEATTLLHGEEEALKADASAFAVRQGGVSADLPTKDYEIDWTGSGDWKLRTAEALVKASGLAKSLGEARRLIEQNGIQINNARPIVGQLYERHDVLPEVGAFKVQRGKKDVKLVRPV